MEREREGSALYGEGVDAGGMPTVNQYTILDRLGEGAFGKVNLCMCNGRPFAVKIYKKSFLRRKKQYTTEGGRVNCSTALQSVAHEIAIMKKLTHMNVVRLHEVIDNEQSDKVYMIIDYCGKGQILRWDPSLQLYESFAPSEPFDEFVFSMRFREMVCGLEYLHSNNIVHRDIKPQNILVNDEGVVKISDFGQASIFEQNDRFTKTVGTIQFLAPECLTNDTREFSGKAADIWALGLTLYALVYKKLPFVGNTYTELQEAILHQELVLPDTPEVSSELRNVLFRLLTRDPESRIKMWELLQDPWLTKWDPPVKPVHRKLSSVTEEDVQAAVIPIERLVFAKRYAKQWKKKISTPRKKLQVEF